jgi:putative tryptophan/tyrosine transport system substrate-binding protein
MMQFDQLKRREFITLLGGAAAWPLAARAQKSEKIARVGYLSSANPRSMPAFQAFEQRLRELGYFEGQNIVIEYRNAEGEVDRLPDLAADLVLQLVPPREPPLRSPFS